jgi:hypothetical protein
MLRKSALPPATDAAMHTIQPLADPAARFMTREMRILDPDLCRAIIRQRQRQGIDRHDEVWQGVYVVPPLANNPHQRLVLDFSTVCSSVVGPVIKGEVLPGANVSDRHEGWEQHFRAPDVVVVLAGSQAVDCNTHWMGGPDFLIEIQSPGDDTEEKIPFYSELRVRELLIVQRDSRHLRLLRHDGHSLVEVGQSGPTPNRWLKSQVLPLAFRWIATDQGPRIQVKRTDGKRKIWTI